MLSLVLIRAKFAAAETMSTPATQPTKTTPVAVEPPKIEGIWRVVLVVLGVIAVGVGAWWWTDPPEKKAFAPQATMSAQTAEVDNDSEVLSGLLIALGGALLLIGANGRVITSVKIADKIELSTVAEAAADAAENETKKQAAQENLDPKKTLEAVESARKTAFAKATLQPLDALDPAGIATDAINMVR